MSRKKKNVRTDFEDSLTFIGLRNLHLGFYFDVEGVAVSIAEKN